MPDIKSYPIPPTGLCPNNPKYPLLHYINYFSSATQRTPGHVYDLFQQNDWQVQWLFRYGPTQRAHYHSASHEAMAVITGSARIRFGVADTDPDMERNTHGEAFEEGGVEVDVNAGDLIIIPAGVSHKTFDTVPKDEFLRLSPGDGHTAATTELRNAYHAIEPSGFTMLGAYPRGYSWDFMEGGELQGKYEDVWSIPKPLKDPVLGDDGSKGGLLSMW